MARMIAQMGKMRNWINVISHSHQQQILVHIPSLAVEMASVWLKVVCVTQQRTVLVEKMKQTVSMNVKKVLTTVLEMSIVLMRRKDLNVSARENMRGTP
jgi:hypothetical protein